MNVLILGAGGMLGHKVWQVFRDGFDCQATVRTRPPGVLFDDRRVVAGVDATDLDRVTALIEAIRPNVVVNCIGVVKQFAAARDPISSITLNSLFPHLVARACAAAGARMIHISTDCVFSGARGRYAETSENVDDEQRLRTFVTALDRVAAIHGLPMLISLHPRTLDRLHHFDIELGAHIRVMKPLGFFDFVRLEIEAACVLSDSGTVQEECCIL